MYAVILTGGKQYRVKEDDVLSIEKLDLAPGRKAQFDRVLLIEDGEAIQVGTPFLDNAMALGLVLENYRDEKIIVFKKKRRKQYRRTRGHRQFMTKVRITRVVSDRGMITADDLAEEKLAPVEKPVPAPKPKPAPAKAPAPAPAKAPVKGKPAKKGPAKKEPAKPKATKKPAPAKKRTTKE